MRLLLPPLLFILFCASRGYGQKPTSLFDTLYAFEEIKITLTYPFDSLYRTKRDEIDSKISIETPKGFLMKDEDMTLNIRGKFRRMKCTMPPLLLNFKKSALRELNLYDDDDELKLVTHCLDTPEGQENLAEERLCYQIYESLTKYSYRSLWVTVEYRDALRPDSSFTSFGLLLEPDRTISHRLGLKEKQIFNISEDSLEFESYSRTAAFNFLIGNRDWSIVASRNAKLFYDSTLSQYYVIPYDFDFSNIVGASYRTEKLPPDMYHPFDRIYSGEYYADKTADILLAFLPTEPQVLQIVSTANNPLDEKARKKIADYLKSWYSQVDKKKPQQMLYGLICRYKGDL